MTIDVLLARTMMDLADSLIEDFDLVDLLTLLSDRCVEVLDVQAAGVMLVSPAGELRVCASSSAEMRALELFEEQSEEGPGQDCYVTGQRVVNVRLATAQDRWPRFAPKAFAAGFRSTHALPMRHHAQTIGALNLFRTNEGQLDEREGAVAQSFADMATIAIVQNRAMIESKRLNDKLKAALEARIVVERAKGIVSERTALDMEQSFSLLRHHAARHHARLVDIAQYIVNGTLRVEALDRAD